MKTVIKNGHVIDPSQDLDGRFDLIVEDGCIVELGENLPAEDADEVIDADGLLVTPGLIDIHVHLRDPGFEYKEDIVSGTRSAAAGGFTSVACMPNTKPVNDNKATTLYMINKAQLEGFANVFPICTITKGQKGTALVEMGDLKQAGCVGFSDDGLNVESGDVLRRAMEYASGFDMPIIAHAEDEGIKCGGVMNEGRVATELGLAGNPWVAEASTVARDLMLAELTGARLHVCHISTRRTVELIREAKARGVKVTCEVTPHHFTLTEEAVRGYDVNAKMGPPLRTADDVKAMKEGLADGTIDAIATDHAPHHVDDKNVEFNVAANGLVGLETALPLALNLVKEGVLTLNQAICCLTTRPASVMRIPRGTLAKGTAADITLIDPDYQWTLDATQMKTKARNTPFDGWELTGAAMMTMCAGKITFQRNS
ncbi:dihydroorotase [Desulfuromonas acetoxidans]|uniref:Dihydroorotase n=1 Tax=Desulfuromonas acetoxidans (strain DSM 684 / 11070) TaxID=281689 RepID=Q1K1T6_DESA6|nr:dihydroorotase [Desulfuromonas acetoxidans]EAT16302.1 dihydroorotase, multifunctional complex type [Desulfuromonas acetoxidans DSM 684]MBF0644891.1 dihydroorotase [Desulfuromonas acetoxidans]NVD25408.1 dihydroorotase [Desulfuromonas acetoxidans]NVE17491.1 dihydroorotase [Desulfuromonas acetoxidans]